MMMASNDCKNWALGTLRFLNITRFQPCCQKQNSQDWQHLFRHPIPQWQHIHWLDLCLMSTLESSNTLCFAVRFAPMNNLLLWRFLVEKDLCAFFHFLNVYIEDAKDTVDSSLSWWEPPTKIMAQHHRKRHSNRQDPTTKRTNNP